MDSQAGKDEPSSPAAQAGALPCASAPSIRLPRLDVRMYLQGVRRSDGARSDLGCSPGNGGFTVRKADEIVLIERF